MAADARVRLGALAAAFEILFELGDVKRGKAAALADRVVVLLQNSLGTVRPRDEHAYFENLRKFVEGLYSSRNGFLHQGSTDRAKLLFRSKRTSEPFIGYSWKGRQVFVACVLAKLGLLDELELTYVLADLVSNEDRLKRILTMLASGEEDQIASGLALCSELQHYPSPESNELILRVWHAVVDHAVGSGVDVPSIIRRRVAAKDPFKLHRTFGEITSAMPRFDNLLHDGHVAEFRAAWAVKKVGDYAFNGVLTAEKAYAARNQGR